MHTKEVSELRRRWQVEKNAVKRIYGCYVNASGEIVTDLDEPLSLMPQEEAEQYFSLLKKALRPFLQYILINVPLDNILHELTMSDKPLFFRIFPKKRGTIRTGSPF